MGMFDFLKVTVQNKTASPQKKAAGAGSCVMFDNKSFPLAALNHRGFVISGFDGSLVKGQKAHVTLSVDDSIGKFSLTTAVLVTEVTGDKMAAEFNLITPEMESLLKQYNQRKKQAPGR